MEQISNIGVSALINARGPFTPLGVSRSSQSVSAATADALLEFADVSALHGAANAALRDFAGSEAGTVVHCAAAAVTLAVAGLMTGADAEKVAALPNTTGMRNRVVLPRGHSVNYGHPIEQAIRLSGAKPVFAGDETECSVSMIADAIEHPGTCCLLLVVSRLTTGQAVDLTGAIEAAHVKGLPVVIDGAAQVFRARELVAMGADLLIVSGQKYLGSPTAGLVFGRSTLINGVRAQDKGIGRGMKASKEALRGVLAAIQHFSSQNEDDWKMVQTEKVSIFNERLNRVDGVTATAEPDPTNAPFPRACLKLDPARVGRSAVEVSELLKSGSPSIWVMDHRAEHQEIILELVPLCEAEVDVIVERLSELMS